MNVLKSTFYAFAIFGIAAFSQISFSQETASNQLKLYSNFAWNSTYQIVAIDSLTSSPIAENVHSTQLGYFSPAFAFETEKGNFHEIEWSRLQINKTDEITLLDPNSQFPQIVDGERKTNILIALKYEYNLFFFKKNEDRKLSASVGFGFSPFYSNAIFLPQLSNVFSSRESNVGVLFSIAPHLNYSLGKKWFLDLNVPLNFAQIQMKNRRIDDPSIDISQRRITTLDANIFPSNYLVRFGVGLRL